MSSQSSDGQVIFFGSFDPLHDGHRNAFVQAKLFGKSLIVIVARDSAILRDKHHTSSVPEQERLMAVAADPSVDTAMLGDADLTSYAILRTVPFDTLALGYDQEPSDEEARRILDENGLHDARVVRLVSYNPGVYKSSFLRKG